MNNRYLPKFRISAEARLCREGPETRNTPPPTVETGSKPKELSPSVADSPEATKKAAEDAAAKRGEASPDAAAKALDKQIADARKQVGDLTSDVATLRREVKKQEQLREKAKQSPTAAPASSAETTPPAPVTPEASSENASAATSGDASTETEVIPTRSIGEPSTTPERSPGDAVPTAGLANDLADEKPLSDAQFKTLQDSLKAKETALQQAQDSLQQLKDSRPEPKNLGEKANRVLSDTSDIMKDPNKSVAEKVVAGIQALGAMLALWREAIGGVQSNLQQGADKLTGKEKEDASKQEHRAALREELKKSGKTAKDLAAEKSQQARDIFSKPDPKIQEAIVSKNTLMGDKAKLQTQLDAAKGQTPPNKESLQVMEAGLIEIDKKIAEAQKVIDVRQSAADTLLADAKELKDMKKAAESRCKEAQDKLYEITDLLDNQGIPALHIVLLNLSFSVDPTLNPQCIMSYEGKDYLRKLGNEYSVSLDISVEPNGVVKGDPMDVIVKMESIAQKVRAAEAKQRQEAREKKA